MMSDVNLYVHGERNGNFTMNHENQGTRNICARSEDAAWITSRPLDIQACARPGQQRRPSSK